MIKRIKKKLSVKIFLITFLLLGVACSGTYLCVSKLLPRTYSNMINQNTENAAIQLVDHLESYSDISDCEDALSDFSKSANATFWSFAVIVTSAVFVYSRCSFGSIVMIGGSFENSNGPNISFSPSS